MATITKRKQADGTHSYTAQIRIRRKGQIIHTESQTFIKKRQAETWARDREGELDNPKELARVQHAGITIAEVLKQYREEFGVLHPMGRSKLSHIKFLEKHDLGQLDAIKLTTQQLIDHLADRLKDGAKPQTVKNDLIWLKTAFKSMHARKGWPLPLEEIEAANTAAKSERMVARPDSRDRRPTAEELEKLDAYFSTRDGRATIPMREIMWFALHSARRQAEITRITWDDLDTDKLTGVVLDAKHPTKKLGNHRTFKFTRKSWEIAQRQPKTGAFIFPYNPKSVGAAFTRACKWLDIIDLHFHDLRHEGTSRLFEAGYSIQEVQLFTLHDDWNVLQRYTHLKPGDVKLKD